MGQAEASGREGGHMDHRAVADVGAWSPAPRSKVAPGMFCAVNTDHKGDQAS